MDNPRKRSWTKHATRKDGRPWVAPRVPICGARRSCSSCSGVMICRDAPDHDGVHSLVCVNYEAHGGPRAWA